MRPIKPVPGYQQVLAIVVVGCATLVVGYGLARYVGLLGALLILGAITVCLALWAWRRLRG